MRKVIISILLFSLTVASFGQQTTPAPVSPQEEYLRKSRGQTAGAVLLMAAGAGLIYGGAAYDMNHLFESTGDKTTPLYVAGLTCVGGSAVLLMAAGRNRRKAREAAVTPAVHLDSAPVPGSTGMNARSFPALGITVKL